MRVFLYVFMSWRGNLKLQQIQTPAIINSKIVKRWGLGMMSKGAEWVMRNYVEAYEQLYQRRPRDLRALDQEWVIVNGARMRLDELEYITRQLQQEYQQTRSKRSVVERLIRWFKG